MPSISLSAATYDRLSALAAEHGLSRSKMVTLLLGRGPSVEVGSERALELLAESAEAGSVQARIALARLMVAKPGKEPAGPPLDELDQLRERRRVGVPRGGSPTWQASCGVPSASHKKTPLSKT
jgi:hypothetical protein